MTVSRTGGAVAAVVDAEAAVDFRAADDSAVAAAELGLLVAVALGTAVVLTDSEVE